ncbi:MAG: lysophospholipid acyltransferase family protein [Chloroflexota bacterium]
MTVASGNEAAGPERPKREAARSTPEALAQARGGAREGLDWLGRQPESRAGILVRALELVGRIVLFGIFRFRIQATGRELLPAAGGYLLVAAAHRGWMDPFLVLHAVPLEPRVWFLGSGPAAFTPRWRERFLHRLGGILPVWRGGVGIEPHVAAARAVLANGGVFLMMPEGGISGPPDRIAAFRYGSALIALRTGAPIVPLALAGTQELYIGKRMASQIMPPTSLRELLGPDWNGIVPAEGSRAELDLAHAVTDRLEALFEPVIPVLYATTIDPPGHPRRLRRLTWLLGGRPRRTPNRTNAQADDARADDAQG